MMCEGITNTAGLARRGITGLFVLMPDSNVLDWIIDQRGQTGLPQV